MIITLNSKNQDNYFFKNDFGDTLKIQPNTKVTVKNVKLRKGKYINLAAGQLSYQLRFDDATAPLYTFTIGEGRYTVSQLEAALNASYNQATYGYNISWKVEPFTNGTQAQVTFIIRGYDAPVNPLQYPVITPSFSTGFEKKVNTQQLSGVLSKTTANVSWTDNYYLYKASIDKNAETLGAAQPCKSGYCEFIPGPNTFFGWARPDWDGNINNLVQRIEFIGPDKIMIIYEVDNSHGGGLTQIVDYTTVYGSIRKSSANGVGTILRAIIRDGTQPGNITLRGFYFQLRRTDGSNTSPDTVTYRDRDERYVVKVNDQFYPVWGFFDNTSSVSGITGHFMETRPALTLHETNSIVTPRFDVIDECSLSGTTPLVVTADSSLTNNTSGAVDDNIMGSGHVAFQLGQTDKEVWFGLSEDTTSANPTSLLYSYKFDTSGNFKEALGGTTSGSDYSYLATDYFRFSWSSTDNPMIEKSTDSGSTYAIVHKFENGTLQDMTIYPKILFPSSSDSTDAVVNIIQQTTFNEYSRLGAPGDLVEFYPEDLAIPLGFTAQSYTFDAALLAGDIDIEAEELMDFDDGFDDSYRVLINELPIRSINGFLGFVDNTVCSMEINSNGDVSYPQEQSTRTHNMTELPINTMTVSVVKQDNSLSIGDFLNDCQITLEVDPPFKI